MLRPSGAESGLELVSQASQPLLYAVFLAGLFSVAFRSKLEVRSVEEALTKRIMMEGIMSIQSGDNPRIVEQKLNVFLAPKLRSGSRKPASAKPEPKEANQPSGEAEVQQDEEMVQLVGETIQQLQNALPDSAKNATGPLRLRDLLLFVPEGTRLEIMNALGEGSPKVGDSASPWTFVFEDIAKLTDREIQMVLREVDTKDLAIAMKGASRTLQDRFFSNMSERVGTMIKEEMARRKGPNAKDIIAVQLSIMQTLRQLEGTGKVSFVR